MSDELKMNGDGDTGHIHAVNDYMQPLWDLMHQEHGLILVEREMHDIMAACKEVWERLRDEAPNEADICDGCIVENCEFRGIGLKSCRHRRAEAQGGEYPRCVNQACQMFGVNGCSEGLDVDGTCETRNDISEKSDGKRPTGEPRWAKPKAEAQGGELNPMTTERIMEIQEKSAYPQSHSVQQALLKVWNECDQYHASNEPPRPAVDWQAVADYLVDAAKMGKSIFWGRLWLTIANALQAGIGGGE